MTTPQFDNFCKNILEQIDNNDKLYEKECAKNVKPETGKMHKALGIPEDKKKVAGMINFAANINKEKDIFDQAQNELENIEE